MSVIHITFIVCYISIYELVVTYFISLYSHGTFISTNMYLNQFYLKNTVECIILIKYDQQLLIILTYREILKVTNGHF